jgi:hypothetical protein
LRKEFGFILFYYFLFFSLGSKKGNNFVAVNSPASQAGRQAGVAVCFVAAAASAA